MKFFPNRLIVATAALALAAGFAPAQAQNLAQTNAPTAEEVDETTLRAFAQASLDVETVIDEWSSRIEATDDSAEAEEMRTTANAEIAAAIEDRGLEVETYNQIYQLAQGDPEVAQSIQRYRQEMQ